MYIQRFPQITSINGSQMKKQEAAQPRSILPSGQPQRLAQILAAISKFHYPTRTKIIISSGEWQNMMPPHKTASFRALSDPSLPLFGESTYSMSRLSLSRGPCSQNIHLDLTNGT